MPRKTNIDLLRIISCLAIIIIHIVSASVTHSSTTVDNKIINTTKLIHYLMNWAVPVFFMISGYCLALKDECSISYCLKHVTRYLCVLFTIGLFFALMERFFVARTMNAKVISSSFLDVISGNLWDHMWFVYSIIGIYLVMPVIHAFLKKNEQGMLYLTVLLFLFSILLPFCQKWIAIGFSIPFGGYLFYVCFGCLLAVKKAIKPVFTYVGIVLGILAFIWILCRFQKEAFEYNHVAVCFMAIGIFLCFTKIKPKETAFLRTLSACTWGVYLIHPLFINVSLKVLKIKIISSYPYLTMLLFAVIIAAISFAVTFGLRKIPLVKKLL